MRIGTAILNNQHRIFLVGVEIGWFHNPSVEVYAVHTLNGHEFAWHEDLFLHGELEVGIVLNGAEFAALAVAHGVAWHLGNGTVALYKEVAPNSKVGSVGAIFVGNGLGGLLLEVVGIDLAVHCIFLCRLIKYGSSLGVDAIEVGDVVVSLGQLLFLHTVGSVPVEVVPTIAFASQYEVFSLVEEGHALYGALLYVAIVALGEQGRGNGRFGVDGD